MPRRDLIFRVFVSSTFSDLAAERNALQERVYPELRKYCQQRGARFQAIDLRWGVSQEAALDQQTMSICIGELRRCQTLSPRPNFIVLLGNRYGWRPLPAEIEAGEFEELLGEVPDVDKPMLTADGSAPAWRDGRQNNRVGWYRRDANAVPPSYVLEHRTIEFPSLPTSIQPAGEGGLTDEDRRRIRVEEQRDWAALEARMRSMLLAAIEKRNWPAADARRFKYEASATHQEIQAGAVQADAPQEHVFCYFREIDGLPTDTRAARDRDIRDDAVDAVAEAQLERLKEELGELLPGDHIHTYRAEWRDGNVATDLGWLCDQVKQDLQQVIDQELTTFKRGSNLDREREAHREFGEERCRQFVGRQELLTRIQAYADSDDARALVVHGMSGSGKTALMAKAAETIAQGGPRQAGRRVVSRFLGATPGSSDLRSLLVDLCRELDVSEIPSEMNDLVKAFRGRLSPPEQGGEAEGWRNPAGDQEGIVLFLDALDQLNPTDNARMLRWLPRKLRPDVKLVVSVLETEQEDGQGARHDDLFELARRTWPESLVEVGSLDAEAAAALLEAWLDDARRTLQERQREEVLARFAGCPLPLYLKLAFEDARRWKSWEGVPHPLSGTVEGILEQLLVRLERPENHGRVLVSRSLGYTATARNGLTEDELHDLLSRDRDVVQNFLARSPESPRTKEDDPLPLIAWSRLFADINPYMTHRRADGTVVMDFYHRQVREAVRRRYLTGDEHVRAHLHLADYFDALDYWAESLDAQQARARRLPPTPRPANVRKVVELPYHRLEVAKLAGKDDPKSPYWDRVADLLTNWQFLEANAEADPNFQELEPAGPSPAGPR